MNKEIKDVRGTVINAISTPMQFGALIVLVVEALLAFLLNKAKADDITVYVEMMVGVLILTIVAVFIIEFKRIKLKEAHVIPNIGDTEDQQKNYKWDVFLAAPMAALQDSDFESVTNKIMEIKKVLEDECDFKRIFFAGNNMTSKDQFDPASLSIEIDINELKESRYFILIYPEKIVSSVLFEAGIALTLGKPSFYFGKKGNFPFLMQEANLKFNHVNIHEAASLDKIISDIHKYKTKLFNIEKIKI